MCHRPPIPAAAFAELLGLPYRKVIGMCREGRIFGAQKHARTHRWWIYPPARILARDFIGLRRNSAG